MHHRGFLQPLRSWGHPLTTQGRKSTDWRYQEGNAPEQPLTNEGGTWWIISNSSSLMVTLGGSSILRVRLIFSPGSGSFPPLPPALAHFPHFLPGPPGVPSQRNYLHPDPCLSTCFGENLDEDRLRAGCFNPTWLPSLAPTSFLLPTPMDVKSLSL